MSSMIVPVIMCGGAGTRLWPASREGMPKQFLPLFSSHSLFQETLLRVANSDTFERPIIVTSATYHALVEQQLREIEVDAELILEQERRDSAPAVAAATIVGLKRRSDALLLLLASDHAIKLVDKFRDACQEAKRLAHEGRIVTFGIIPDQPSTDYGYLKAGAALGGSRVRKLDAFVEKPDAKTAEEYVAQGYLWNSGNFLFRADVMMNEMKHFQPSIWSAVSESVAGAQSKEGALCLAREPFARSPRISIDYAVMEKTSLSVVLPIDVGWSDLGSWESIWANMPHDRAGNAVAGPCELLDVRNSLVRSDGTLLAAVMGLDDVVVVVANGAVLVAPKAAKSEMKALLSQLKASGRPEAD